MVIFMNPERREMYKKILVPLDGSETSECVLPYVQAVAAGDNNLLFSFLYVIEVNIPLASQKYKKKITAEARSGAESYLNRLMNKLKYKDMVKSLVLEGKIANSVIEYAEKQKMDLIIMATHGISGINRWSHGSVADKVLHSVKTPIWLIRANVPARSFPGVGKKIRILVPLDGSKLAEGALKHVNTLTTIFGKDTVDTRLIRVIEPFSPPFIYPPEMPMNMGEYMEHERQRASDICIKYLGKVQSKLEIDGVQSAMIAQEGIPADVIIDYASKNDMDLIVMSTHGRTGLSRWALGSIAEKVLQRSTCPVFMVQSKSKRK